MSKLFYSDDANKKDIDLYLILLFISLIFLTIDSRTSWLNPSKNLISYIISPIVSSTFSISNVLNSGKNYFHEKDQLVYSLIEAYKTIDELGAKVSILDSLKEENTELRTLLNLGSQSNESLVLAEIVSLPTTDPNDIAIINKGSNDNVYPGQAVIDNHGLIGQIIEVKPDFSKIMLLTDSRSGVPSEILNKGIRINVYGQRSRDLRSDPISKYFDVKKGDLLITSGLGKVFPRGVPVANIETLTETNNLNTMEITAKPIARLNTSRYVFLVFGNSVSVQFQADTEQ